jgi:hypothetical protein
MGCCQAKETLPSVQTNLHHRSNSLARKYTIKDQNTITKKFSSQVEYLKSFSSVVSSFLVSGQKSSADYQKNLGMLPFYLSSKNIETFNESPENLYCPDCLISFNEEEEIPLVLTCGHCLCRNCCEKYYLKDRYIPCPSFCPPLSSDPPDNLETNNDILTQSKLLKLGQYCEAHQAPAHIFCTSCKVLACDDCDHSKHPTTLLNSSDFQKEYQLWDRTLETYLKRLEAQEKDLSSHFERCETLSLNLNETLSKHFSQLKNSQSKVKNLIKTSSESHLEEVNNFIEMMIKTMPARQVSLYSDVISEELMRVESLLTTIDSLPPGVSLKELTKVPLKPNPILEEPNYSPWEDCLKTLSSEKNFEYFILALTGLALSVRT